MGPLNPGARLLGGHDRHHGRACRGAAWRDLVLRAGPTGLRVVGGGRERAAGPPAASGRSRSTRPAGPTSAGRSASCRSTSATRQGRCGCSRTGTRNNSTCSRGSSARRGERCRGGPGGRRCSTGRGGMPRRLKKPRRLPVQPASPTGKSAVGRPWHPARRSSPDEGELPRPDLDGINEMRERQMPTWSPTPRPSPSPPRRSTAWLACTGHCGMTAASSRVRVRAIRTRCRRRTTKTMSLPARSIMGKSRGARSPHSPAVRPRPG